MRNTFLVFSNNRHYLQRKKLFLVKNKFFSVDYVNFCRLSGQWPPRKIDPRLGLGFGSRLGLVLGLGVNQTISTKENSPPVRIRVGVREKNNKKKKKTYQFRFCHISI